MLSLSGLLELLDSLSELVTEISSRRFESCRGRRRTREEFLPGPFLCRQLVDRRVVCFAVNVDADCVDKGDEASTRQGNMIPIMFNSFCYK